MKFTKQRWIEKSSRVRVHGPALGPINQFMAGVTFDHLFLLEAVFKLLLEKRRREQYCVGLPRRLYINSVSIGLLQISKYFIFLYFTKIIQV